jgi:hypothetical protein
MRAVTTSADVYAPHLGEPTGAIKIALLPSIQLRSQREGSAGEHYPPQLNCKTRLDFIIEVNSVYARTGSAGSTRQTLSNRSSRTR